MFQQSVVEEVKYKTPLQSSTIRNSTGVIVSSGVMFITAILEWFGVITIPEGMKTEIITVIMLVHGMLSIKAIQGRMNANTIIDVGGTQKVTEGSTQSFASLLKK